LADPVPETSHQIQYWLLNVVVPEYPSHVSLRCMSQIDMQFNDGTYGTFNLPVWRVNLSSEWPHQLHDEPSSRRCWCCHCSTIFAELPQSSHILSWNAASSQTTCCFGDHNCQQHLR
jgi:hypothetical protein